MLNQQFFEALYLAFGIYAPIRLLLDLRKVSKEENLEKKHSLKKIALIKFIIFAAILTVCKLILIR